MSILITGGTGFIGAEVVRILLNKGEKDIAVFDLNPSTKLLDEVAGKVEIIRGDLGNFSHVLNAIQTFQPKVIYHLGGMLSVPSDADPAASFRANAMGTFHILEAARLFNVPQVLFSSTIGTYDYDITKETIDDYTLQRPQLFYGATKTFCEHMGLFFKRKYKLDFRGVRYPSIVGPGVKTPGVAQYTSWVIEECAKGNPFTIYVTPDTQCPVMYYKDAGLAIVKLGEAPVEDIKMVNYIITGAKPIASAQELANLVREKIPGAQIAFEPDLELKTVLDKLLKPLDDRVAKKEWGWEATYNQNHIVDDMLRELKSNPQRYA